jgi:hypothetical protein
MKIQARHAPSGASCSGRAHMFQSFSKSRAGNPLQHRISSARPLGFNKASEAAAQFGASRVFIVLR